MQTRLQRFLAQGLQSKTTVGMLLLFITEIYLLVEVGRKQQPYVFQPTTINNQTIMPLSTCSESIDIAGGHYQNVKVSTCTSVFGKVVDIREFTKSENLPGLRGISLSGDQWNSLIQLDAKVQEYLKDPHSSEPRTLASGNE